jgi:magnesium-transporting ATPase (P-type)
MSVIAMTHLDKKQTMMAFVKGSPEKLAELSLKHTIPKDFERVLADYAQIGFRIIACGYKEIPDSRPYSELN